MSVGQPVNNTYKDITLPPPVPLLVRQIGTKCIECSNNTSDTSHKYCYKCATNDFKSTKNISVYQDKLHREKIMLYHLKHTFRNRFDIFTNKDNQDDIFEKRYLKIINGYNLQHYLKNLVIFNKCKY